MPQFKMFVKGVLVTDTTDAPTALASFAMQLEKNMQAENSALELQVFDDNGQVEFTRIVKTSGPMHKNGHILYTDKDSQVPDQICDDNGQVVLGLCKECGAAEVQLDEKCSRMMG